MDLALPQCEVHVVISHDARKALGDVAHDEHQLFLPFHLFLHRTRMAPRHCAGEPLLFSMNRFFGMSPMTPCTNHCRFNWSSSDMVVPAGTTVSPFWLIMGPSNGVYLPSRISCLRVFT